MTDVISNLERGRYWAWKSLAPAFDHAIALAREADFIAGQASNIVQAGIDPVYPPLVLMLAEAGKEGAR